MIPNMTKRFTPDFKSLHGLFRYLKKKKPGNCRYWFIGHCKYFDNICDFTNCKVYVREKK